MATRKPIKRRNKERTRALIRQAALECFATNRADRTTMLEIARRAEVPNSLVHYYYGSQEELFAEVFASVVEQIRASVTPPLEEPGASPRTALLGYVQAHFDWARDHPSEFAVWLYFYHSAVLEKRYRKLNADIRSAGNARIASIIYAGLHRGEFRARDGVSVEGLATEIQTIMTGAWVMGAIAVPAHEPEYYAGVRARILDLLGAPAHGDAA